MVPTTSTAPTPCPGCGGAKVQTNKDGIKVICPVCGGTGTYRSPGTIDYGTTTWNGGADKGTICRLDSLNEIRHSEELRNQRYEEAMSLNEIRQLGKDENGW